MSAFHYADAGETAGKDPLRVLARISFLSTEDGGKANPVTTTYRPNHNFGGPDGRLFYIGQVEISEGTWVHPGETVDLVVTFLNVSGLFELLTVGRQWRIQEGPKHVARAEILKVLHSA